MEKRTSIVNALLIDLVDEAFDRKSWHGTNLRGAIRGVPADLAAWRPAEGRHNIWELVVHAAYWKYAVRRRLVREKRGSFSLEGSNWWARPQDGGPTEWKRDVSLLVAEHARLRIAVETFPVSRLSQRGAGSAFTYAGLIRGAAAHDLYHAGQIQLIKRLAGESAT